ncbi:alcohol oxidase [Dentipellis sp. KUC8613]|nr:alcohol oxidase [Dentipellis sp. KUC8613]
MPIVSKSDFLNTTLDYLIVGGGTAGLVLAARLSENPDVIVGVLEAGEDRGDTTAVQYPGFANRNVGNPDFDWTFSSVPQKHANERVTSQPRGKGLGGSSMLHFLGSSRGSKAEYDAFAEFGSEDWNWDSLLHYTKKSEAFVPLTDENINKAYAALDPQYHGAAGPIKKCYSLWCNPLHVKLLAALDSVGLPVNPDPANGVNVGANSGLCTVDPETATRSYAASGYYQPNSQRRNLLILTGVLVSKVIFEDAPNALKRAVGVEFEHNKETAEIRGVRKEVIISAGSFQTPVVLELSGVGNPQILQNLGIPSMIDLPGVGENLQDHVVSYSIWEVDSRFDTLDILSDPDVLAQHMELYKQKAGIITGTACHTFAYMPASVFASKEKIQQWQCAADMAAKDASPTQKRQYEHIRSWIADPKQATTELLLFPGHFFCPTPRPEPGKRYVSIATSLMHPLSRGSVHAASTDPAVPPAVDPNYFAQEADIDMIVAGMRHAQRVADAFGVVDAVQPKPDATDEELKEYVRDTCTTSFHPLGTAAMGRREEGGVVDARLKVYGTENLRVVRVAPLDCRASLIGHFTCPQVDCSILPMEIAAHLQSIAYALAEKVSVILIESVRVLSDLVRPRT